MRFVLVCRLLRSTCLWITSEAIVDHSAGAHLDCGVLEWLVRVGHILHADAVELSLVDVRQPVVLAPLARRYRRLQEEAEAVVGEAVESTGQLPSNRVRYKYLAQRTGVVGTPNEIVVVNLD